MRTRIATKMIITLSICFFTILLKAQNASVEKSTFGIQTGFSGIWAHREVKLTNEIALRAELGMDVAFLGGRSSYFEIFHVYVKPFYVMRPVITIEPRWYYNLEKRQSKSKNIAGNSGNFLTIQTNYYPNWFAISDYDNIKIVNKVSIIPTWGIKRNIGNHFTYETGIGLGYLYYFGKIEDYSGNVGSVIPNLHLRVGYRF